MKKLLIGFSKPKKWKAGAELIKVWQGGTNYSHAYFRVHNSYTDVWLVYQASLGSVNCESLETFKLKNDIVEEFEVDVLEAAHRAALKRAHNLLGKPYGYVGLLKIILYRILGRKVKGDGERSFHCSELIAALFPDLIALDLPDDFIEPVHLYKYLKERAF